MAVAAKADGKVERHARMERHGRGNIEDLEPDPWLPVADQNVGVNERRFDILAQRVSLCCGEVGSDVRNNHVEAGEYDMSGVDPMRRSRTNIIDHDALARMAHIDAGRVEANTGVMLLAIERGIIETGENDVIHRIAGRNARHQRTHQQPRKRGIAVREVIDVGLLPFRILARRQAETGKAGIPKLSELGCGNRIASERKEAERASLEQFANSSLQPQILIR